MLDTPFSILLLQSVFICRPGYEESLLAEINIDAPASKAAILQPGVVSSNLTQKELTESNLKYAFARQLLPNSAVHSDLSVRECVNCIITLLSKQVGDSPWRIHIIEPETTETGRVYNRAKIIEKELIAALKLRLRFAKKLLLEDSHQPSALLQVLLLEKSSYALSFVSKEEHQQLNLSNHPAGLISIEDDLQPPSRAFKKILEALTVFDDQFFKGQQCVDLGASPGGWTHVAVAAGCKVTAIDRSPLSDALMHNKSVTFIAANALSWEPREQIDWLLCDVITEPHKTRALIEKWVSKKLCKKFCVTMKFKGAPEIGEIEGLKEFLGKSVSKFGVRHLTYNKNEITWWGIV